MRHRTKSVTQPFTTSYILTGVGGSKICGEIMDDVSDGDHVTPNPCEHTKVRVLHADGAYRWVSVWDKSPAHPGPTTYGVPTNAGTAYRSVYSDHWIPGGIPSVSDLYSDLESRLADACNNAGRSSLHLISFLREMESTVSMLKNPFKALDFVAEWASDRAKRGTLKNAFRSAHSRKLGKPLSAASNAWLEGTYGWNPFVGDLLAAAEAAGGAWRSRRALADEGPKKVTMSNSAQGSITAPPSSGDSSSYLRIKSGRLTFSRRVRLWTTLKPNPSLASENAVTSIARYLNIDRLGYAVWDAVPYSFVVDWFLPLGDYLDKTLQGPAALLSCGLLWSSKKDKSTFSVELVGNDTHDFGSFYTTIHYIGGGSYAEQVETFSRGGAEWSPSTLTNSSGMHGTRIASGAALLHGLLERWHR